MPSWRTSLSLDLQTDRDLIDRLLALQAQGQASAEIRQALREHFGLTVTSDNIMQELQALKALVQEMLSRRGAWASPEAMSPPTQPATTDADVRLSRSLGRFKKVGDDA